MINSNSDWDLYEMQEKRTSEMATTISSFHKTIIKRVIGRNVQIFSATAAKVYQANPSPKVWTDLQLVGAIVLVKDNSRGGSLFLRLVDLKRETIAWEQEIYLEMVYYEDLPYFYSFASESCMVGLCFVDPVEARQFSDILSKKRAIYDPVIQDPIKDLKKITRRGKINRDLISGPYNFQHLSHMGFNQDRMLDAENVPEDWKMAMGKSDSTKDELESIEFTRNRGNLIDKNQNSPTILSPVETNPKAPPIPPRRVFNSPITSEQYIYETPIESPVTCQIPSAPEIPANLDLNQPVSSTIHKTLMSSIRNTRIESLRKIDTENKIQKVHNVKSGLMTELLAKALTERSERGSTDSSDEE
jgi:neural Wiskott-Aldrich syndrome protein